MKELIDVIKNFSNKKILVLGDIMLDKYTWGKIERLNPDTHAAHLVNVTHENFILGGAANVANNLASLGAKTHLLGVTGEDFYGKKIKGLCPESKIFFHQFYSGNPTIVKQRIIAHDKQVIRLDFGEENLEKICEKDQRTILRMLDNTIKLEKLKFDAAILSDYNKVFFTQGFTQEIIKLLNENKIKSFVDPKPANINQFKKAYTLSPNLKEAEEITKLKYSDKNPLEKIASNLTNSLGSERIIITCGEKGVFGYNKMTNSGFLRKSKAKQVSDQTGAGDTFIAAYTLADVSGISFNHSLDIANSAAAVVVGKVGTATLTQEELINSLEQ